MNTKMIAIKISLPLLLAGLLTGNAAWAEGKARSKNGVNLACNIEKDRTRDCGSALRCGGFLAGNVFTMGDLKLRVAQDVNVNSGDKFALIDVKAPGYSKRNIKIPLLGIASETICGQEITFALVSDSNLVVKISDF